MKLDAKAYFFNAKMDYLPYYKNLSIELEKSVPIKELLPMIKKQSSDFSYPETNLYFRLNGMVLDGTQSVEEIVNKLGTELQIDPISTYRSTNGLTINDDDFMQSFELLAPYASEEDKAYYQTLYPLHYASDTFSYNNQYIGDAILLLAYKMITDGNENKEEILDVTSSHYDGLWECEYENNLFHAEDYSTEIAKLKEMAKDAPNKYKPLFARKYKSSEIKHIEGRNVAFYAGIDPLSQSIISNTLEQIESKGATAIRYSKMCKLAGQTLLETNPKTAYLKMGMMLLDAMDSGADLLIVHNEDDAELFKQSIGYCEKIAQRDIRLDIISRSKLMGMIGKAVA
ncbi:MAG: hypothetical protein HF962_01830 [Sulfurovum sp.]|nr:hypothetical protein [Sulfurovum sp.]